MEATAGGGPSPAWRREAGWIGGWLGWALLVFALSFSLRGGAGPVRVAAWAELAGIVCFLPVFFGPGRSPLLGWAAALARALAAQALFAGLIFYFYLAQPVPADRPFGASACWIAQAYLLSFAALLGGLFVLARALGFRPETAFAGVFLLAGLAVGSLYYGEAFLSAVPGRPGKAHLLSWALRVNPAFHLARILGFDLVRGEYLYRAEGWHDQIGSFTSPGAGPAILAQAAAGIAFAALGSLAARIRGARGRDERGKDR